MTSRVNNCTRRSIHASGVDYNVVNIPYVNVTPAAESKHRTCARPYTLHDMHTYTVLLDRIHVTPNIIITFPTLNNRAIKTMALKNYTL